MRLKPKSLQGRLLLGILLSLACTLALGGVVVYSVVDARLREDFDDGLEEKLNFYRTTLFLQEGKPKWRMGQAEWERISKPPNPDYVEFWFLPKGKFIYRSPGLDGQDLPRIELEGGSPAFTSLELFGTTPVRMVSRRVFPSQDSKGKHFPVQVAVARQTASLEAALTQVKWFLIKTAILTTGVLMLAARWIIRRGVKPVASLAGQIEVMPLMDSDHRFGLPGAPSELQPVVGRLNALMDRVGAAIEHERLFTSNAAHELRNPLAAIRSRVEAALNRPRSVEEYEETLEGILESQTGMQRVVDHLLLLARLESGHPLHEFSQEPVALSGLLRKAWRSAFERASERRLKVTWDITEPEEDPVLPLALVEIVLRNLFENAAAYTPEGGQVRITAALAGGRVRIRVANTDPGLPEDQLENTFSPFWRGDPNASGHRGNAGIGLALVRRVMETMRGTVTAKLESGEVVYALDFPAGTATVERGEPPREPVEVSVVPGRELM